ncbi:MAG: site-specific DNA-methyltransferase [Rhodospirillales bacterium]|nr:site-specific DNA-methyltransferase [Rhodospirillales bacterium]
MTKKISKPGQLAEDFFYRPFTTLDATSKWWQDRKNKWLGIGFRSDRGRRPSMKSMGSAFRVRETQQKTKSTTIPAWSETSIFDPVLAEILYRWFVPAGGAVFDPFCGGSVRGIVASMLDLHYTGLDIRPEQVRENQKQAKKILLPDMPKPIWKVGDACGKSLYRIHRGQSDFIFSCPPYGDLEVYSKRKEDISNMPWDTFVGALTHSIKQACTQLKNNRFAVFVVSDFRDKNGMYRGFPDIVRQAFNQAGLKNYGELVLLNALGTLPVRTRGAFEKSRKIGRAHQNVLLFVKGDPAKAIADLGDVQCSDPLLKIMPESS